MLFRWIFEFLKIPIYLEGQENTTFTWLYGRFVYRRMPSGLCDVLSMFQQCMMVIFYNVNECKMKVFMDEFLVYDSKFESCLANLSKVLQICEKVNLLLNWKNVSLHG